MGFMFDWKTDYFFQFGKLLWCKYSFNLVGIITFFPNAKIFKQARKKRTQNYSSNFLNKIDALCPPNPKVLLIAALTSFLVTFFAL